MSAEAHFTCKLFVLLKLDSGCQQIYNKNFNIFKIIFIIKKTKFIAAL